MGGIPLPIFQDFEHFGMRDQPGLADLLTLDVPFPQPSPDPCHGNSGELCKLLGAVEGKILPFQFLFEREEVFQGKRFNDAPKLPQEQFPVRSGSI